MSKPNTADEILSQIYVVPYGCHFWIGYVGDQGYGTCRYQGKVWLAHRIVFVLKGGIIPDGYLLDHLCRNPRCVNPEHLEPVTHAENCKRGRGCICKGCRSRFWQTLSYRGNFCATCRQSRRQVRAWKYAGQETEAAKAAALVEVWEGGTE